MRRQIDAVDNLTPDHERVSGSFRDGRENM